ncbi:hypothetical protein AVEN_104362-1 [Araneus ventricosus]|uniref:Uncharacterized protein n=1 Tax=Araneus ventricosus TaxID=182803 RepID=A0A4Y2BV49_ARAVE|nr:hypothetical protein AVEN_104362-1 [Araneus ventricosus]
MNACCDEQKRNERLKLELHWTVSQRVSVVQQCACAGDDVATPRTVSPFHVFGHVYRHNVRVWAAESPRAYVDYERNTLR